ncbi:hypothetical protein [Streptomyces bauhiniae]|uniref:Uncharacterized protein n=1 Tax=Streptomyces bauhiniae TaxID=2340725 RepID=A0A7K3QRD2_9ACTN|nr:hypothetical protein [Streptomyces bauhiniae]NEB92458.1 hypothetical protein [Streptomyces bauhiniae]
MSPVSVNVGLTVPIIFLPALWYSVTARDETPDCSNSGQEFTADCYSNAGTPYIECGLCGQPMTIISATLYNPQPTMS